MKKNNRKKVRVYDELSALKGRIREKKTSYRGLSEVTGISLNALYCKINGYSAMGADEICMIADELDISVDEIVKYFFPQMLQNAI